MTSHRLSLGLVASVLVATLLVCGGCVDPHEEEERAGWSIGASGGELTSEPQMLEFGAVALNAEATKSIEIANIGLGAVEIAQIELREHSDSGSDGEREFYQGEGFVEGPFLLEAGQSHTVSVRYLRRNDGLDAGTVVFHTRQAQGATFEVPISASEVFPDIDAPEKVTFGRVLPRPGEPEWQGEHRLMTVRNAGHGVLRIEDVYVAEGHEFHVSFPQPTSEEIARGLPPDPENDTNHWPQQLAPGKRFDVRVWLRPDDNLPARGQLVFETNDPDESLLGVELSDARQTPCIDVYPRGEVGFGEVLIGDTSRQPVTIENCSRTQTLEISDVRLTGDAGGAYMLELGGLAAELDAAPALLAPGERRQVEIVLEATAERRYTGELVISSNDEARAQLRLPLVATGNHRHCPQARAQGWIQGTNRPQTTIDALPLNTIMLDGSDSSSPNGDIVSYEWTILSHPQGSTQRLLPDNSSFNPRLFLDVAGTYEVELVVRDDAGNESCGQRAVITINAVPGDDAYVQLVWQTPADPDPADRFGTDMDLHYLHPDGQWDDLPWDIFWRNPSEDWGVRYDSSDDPSLDIDDTDGAGPENIGHSGLENMGYRVGVYYYSDKTLGQSYATVRIYLGGVLEQEFRRKPMARNGTFWDVALVQWPSRTVTAIDQLHQGFPEN